ncbi:MAG TPA: SAM-dependent methyltransferase [Mycobacteriales bacterium]|nr:SAM-dependent methyltransferase [Mycobacteriales bacterium]
MRSWREAWTAAVYGPGGFYARGSAPAAHFRTSVHASPLYAGAVAELLRRVDAAVGHPDPIDLVDVGAGRAELLDGVQAHLSPDLRARTRFTAVEIAPGFPVSDVGAMEPVTGLVFANEWLDDVPLDVVELTGDGPRLVLVDPDGTEALGPAPDPADLAWLERWWPLEVGDRAEVGRTRDEAWAAAIGRLARGVAVAVDYGHEAAARPRAGTLTGYRDGVQVPPVPDGSCNLTAHVALDSLAAAGRAAGAGDTRLDDQRTALMSLGVNPRRPPLDPADPAAYLAALRRAGEAAELTDRAGLGAFGWLVQGVGTKVPFPPMATRARVRRAPAPPPG